MYLVSNPFNRRKLRFSDPAVNGVYWRYSSVLPAYSSESGFHRRNSDLMGRRRMKTNGDEKETRLAETTATYALGVFCQLVRKIEAKHAKPAGRIHLPDPLHRFGCRRRPAEHRLIPPIDKHGRAPYSHRIAGLSCSAQAPRPPPHNPHALCLAPRALYVIQDKSPSIMPHFT